MEVAQSLFVLFEEWRGDTPCDTLKKVKLRDCTYERGGKKNVGSTSKG